MQNWPQISKKTGRRPYPVHPPRSEVIHGCTCQKFNPDTQKHEYDLGVDSKCDYHRYAALHPEDHRSPWNCPTYWDGCNCPDYERLVRDVIGSQRKRRGHGKERKSKLRRAYNPYY
jgi:hypothetical protein